MYLAKVYSDLATIFCKSNSLSSQYYLGLAISSIQDVTDETQKRDKELTEALIYKNVGVVHSLTKQFDKAAEDNHKALDMIENFLKDNNNRDKTDFERKLSELNLSLGYNYISLNQCDKAKEHLEIAMKTGKSLGNNR